jgi:hypothetical protein
MSDLSDSLAEFNAIKAADHQALYPAKVIFTRGPGTEYACSFGEVKDDGGLHPSGQIVQHHRNGVIYWPRTSGHSPDLLSTFKITACAQDPSLVGTIWQIDQRTTAAHEPVWKFDCHQQL